MNRGVREADSELLSFLHADSTFPDPLVLQKGVDTLRKAFARRGDQRSAGHFPLRFRRSEENPSIGYSFYEFKARDRLRRWYSTGEFVRANAWQLVVAQDLRRQFRQGLPVERMSAPDLKNFDRRWDRLTGNFPGRVAAAILSSIWFRWFFRRRRQIESGPLPGGIL